MGETTLVNRSGSRVRPLALHSTAAHPASGNAPGEETLYDIAEFFKVIGDLTRMKIINALFPAEMCVHDLAALLGMRQPAVSHQLRVLKQAGLVRHRKDGRHAYYFLADEHVKKIVRQALTHVRER
jgi:ArsR family transcriptional regulator, lead/cadmium/zinc/bismuth-responsive transcriptional repressor